MIPVNSNKTSVVFVNMPGCLRLNGAIMETTDRTADWLDMRMTGLAQRKLWTLNVCQAIASQKCRVSVPCISLWNVRPSACWKGQEKPSQASDTHCLPGHNKQGIGKAHQLLFHNELKVSEGPWPEDSSLSHSKSSMGWFSCLSKMFRIKKTHTLCLWRWHHLILPWLYWWLHH